MLQRAPASVKEAAAPDDTGLSRTECEVKAVIRKPLYCEAGSLMKAADETS